MDSPDIPRSSRGRRLPAWRLSSPLGRGWGGLSLVATLALAVLPPQPAEAVPALIGKITATTATNQTDTAVPFTIPVQTPIVIHCDAACYIKWVASGAATTSSYNYRLGANESVLDKGGATLTLLSVLSVSGTTNCYISRIDD